MASANGTVTRTASNMVGTSRNGVRGATGGNKNTNAKRSPQGAPMAGKAKSAVNRSLVGPDKGQG